MGAFEIMSQVENQLTQIDKAMAVLNEATEHFTIIDHWQYLPHHAEHIMLLLYVAEDLVRGMEPKLKNVVNELLEKHKEEKR